MQQKYVSYHVNYYQTINHVKDSKKKPTVKRLLAHINSIGANNWGESVVEETLCFFCVQKESLMKIIK